MRRTSLWRAAVLVLGIVICTINATASLITPAMGEEVSQSEDSLTPDEIGVIIANEIFLSNQIPIYLAQSYLYFSFNGAVDASLFTVNPTFNSDQTAALSAT